MPDTQTFSLKNKSINYRFENILFTTKNTAYTKSKAPGDTLMGSYFRRS